MRLRNSRFVQTILCTSRPFRRFTTILSIACSLLRRLLRIAGSSRETSRSWHTPWCPALTRYKPRRLSHVIGFDDAPFARTHRGDVLVIGAVFAGNRLDGVLIDRVRRDGANSARTLIRMIRGSKFVQHLQLVMLQGIALAGFNVVDVFELHRQLALPVLVIARRRPNLAAVREALITRVPAGRRKWSIIERLGPMEPAAGVFVQRVGISLPDAATVIQRFAIHSSIPEPLRVAHMIAGSGGRV